MKDFRLNEVCTTQTGARYIGTFKEVKKESIWEDCIEDYIEWEDVEYEGICLMPENYSNRHVVLKDNKLFLGDCEVTDYQSWVNKFSSLSDEIPRLYIIRTYNVIRGYYSFECGFDLLGDGRAWEGITRSEHDSVADALRLVREKIGDDFIISLEEPMRL